MNELEVGSMVTIKCEGYATVYGIVGIITDVVQPSEHMLTGPDVLYKIDFASGRSKLPSGFPTWWRAVDIERVQ